MKILIVSPQKDSPVDQVFTPLWRELRRQGVDAYLVRVESKSSFAEAWLATEPDVCHFGYPNFNPQIFPEEATHRPVTTNIWTVPNKKVLMQIVVNDVDAVVAPNAMLVQQLGYELGYTSVYLIQQVFDHDKFRPLPAPAGDFTVGVFGSDCATKRFEVVEQACRLAGVAYRPVIKPASRDEYDLDPIEDVYAHSHVMAHASFLDPSSVVCLEGMLCGRPALTTRNCGMVDILVDGQGGYFYDGSPKDLATKITAVKNSWEQQAQLAPIIRSRLLSLEEGAKLYVKMWEAVVNG